MRIAGWIVAWLLLGALAVRVRADEPAGLHFSGAIRVRQEVLDGQYRPDLPDQDRQLSLRTTLRADWRRGDWRLYGEIMDSRAWRDAATPTATDINVLEPSQAFLERELGSPFGANLEGSVQFGRLAMNLGSRRLISSGDYSNTWNSYTGLRADFDLPAQGSATFFHVLPQRRMPDDAESLHAHRFGLDYEGLGQQMWGALFTRPAALPGGTQAELGYTGFRERDRGTRATRDRQLHNLGLRALREPSPGSWDHEIEGIYQFGKVSADAGASAARLDASAYFLHIDAGYSFVHPARPRLSLEYDRASGDGPGATYRRFDTLFGIRHPDLAPGGLYALLARANLRTLGLRLELAPGSRTEMLAAARVAWADSATDAFSSAAIRDASGAAGRFAGTQLDTRVRYWLVPGQLRMEINATWFHSGGLMRAAPNASGHRDTGYLAAALNYSF